MVSGVKAVMMSLVISCPGNKEQPHKMMINQNDEEEEDDEMKIMYLLNIRKCN